MLVEVTASTTPSTFGRTITLNFRNGKGGQDLPQTTISIGSLIQTPINPRPSAFVSTLVNGVTVSEAQQLVLRGASSGTWRVAYNGEVSAPLSPTINSFDLQNVLNNFLGVDNVVVASSSLGGLTTDRIYNITFGGTQTGINMQPLFGDAANISNVSARSITTTYNAASELLSVNDPSSDVSFVRDNLGRATTVSSTVNGVGFSMGQSFDIVGNRTELRVSGSGTPDFRNIYRYDKLNRLTEVIQTNQVGGNQVLPKRVTMAYNALGQRTQIARFQSTGTANPVATTDFRYDTANRLSDMAHKQGATNLNTYAYTYDPLSRLASVESTLDGLTSYIYNQNDEVREASNTGAANESYDYDANGNRNTNGFTTASDNRMTASLGFTYLYDNEGNLTRRTNTISGAYTTYTWDHRNRLTQVTERTQTNTRISEINYEYDAFNRLVRRHDALVASFTPVTYWVYDEGTNPLLEYFGGNPLIQHRYVWSDNVDDLLADEQNPGLSSRNTLWALSDHLGSIRDIADTSESNGTTSIANHRRYDSFGRRVWETNHAVDLVFGYTGKLFDETTRLQNNLNRWYDSSTGRWISQDPIGFAGGDTNLYRYVGNGPTMATDPSGLKGWEIGGLTPGQWTYATGVLFYEWGANGYRAGRSLVTGEAGAHMGERAVAMSQHESGNKFDGDAGDWWRFTGNIAQEMVGANSIAEGAVGVDMAELRELDAWERGTRISSGTGAMAGSAAGGLGIAGKAGVGIGNIKVPYTPTMPVIPLPDFMRRPLIRRSGTMTASEEAEIMSIMDEYETTVDVVGSRAKATGRNLETDYPKGKGSGTRSDIDFRIDLDHPTLPYLIQELERVNGGIGSASIKHGFTRPTFPPFFRLSSNGVIYVGPSFGSAGIGIGVGGYGPVNYVEKRE